MTPTPKLRYLDRVEPMYTQPDGSKVVKVVRVLQQWWEDREWYNISAGTHHGEWRDVPVEKQE